MDLEASSPQKRQKREAKILTSQRKHLVQERRNPQVEPLKEQLQKVWLTEKVRVQPKLLQRQNGVDLALSPINQVRKKLR